MRIVNFGVNVVVAEIIKIFIARILNPSIVINRETIGTDVNSLNGQKVRIRNGKRRRWNYIEILSDLRAKYSCFEESEEPYYRALSAAIKAIREQMHESEE